MNASRIEKVMASVGRHHRTCARGTAIGDGNDGVMAVSAPNRPREYSQGFGGFGVSVPDFNNNHQKSQKSHKANNDAGFCGDALSPQASPASPDPSHAVPFGLDRRAHVCPARHKKGPMIAGHGATAPKLLASRVIVCAEGQVVRFPSVSPAFLGPIAPVVAHSAPAFRMGRHTGQAPPRHVRPAVRDDARLNPPWPPDGRNITESSMTAITDLTLATKEFYRAYRVAQVAMERAGFAGWPKAQASYERWFEVTGRAEGLKAKRTAEAEGGNNRDVLNAIIAARNAAADAALA